MSQPNTFNTLGQQIEIIRGRREKLSLYRVAKTANIDYSYLYRIMRGKSKPSREKLSDVCRGLHCSPEERVEIYKAAGYYISQEEAEEITGVAA